MRHPIVRSLLALLLLAACSDQPRAGADSADSALEEDETPRLPGDTAVVEVRGPTLVAFLPVDAQAEAERDDDAATALDDFQFGLAQARDSLERRGVKVEVRSADSLVLREGARRWSFRPSVDSGGAGFYLVAPGRAPVVRYGVVAWQGLVSLAADSLGAGPPFVYDERAEP